MKTHQRELTFSGSRFELRPYIVSDPAKPSSVLDEESREAKDDTTQMFFTMIELGKKKPDEVIKEVHAELNRWLSTAKK